MMDLMMDLVMDLKPFLLDTRSLFHQYLNQTTRSLSAYSFATHFLWRDHFSFHWTLYQDHFLLFAEYDRCVYMPLPPLGSPDPEIVTACFDWMDRINPDKAISRIENIPEADLPFYQASGLKIELKDPEYLYKRDALVGLKGDRYKTARWACNRFEKKHHPIDRPYTPSDQNPPLTLFEKWSKGRAMRHPNPVYLQMLRDSESVHRRALAESETLGLIGRVIEVSGRVVGYTFGFPQNSNTFCIFLEVADLELAGASSYLFRSFCKTLDNYQWINAMDDSGLEGLRRAKESYHPERKVGCYVARR